MSTTITTKPGAAWRHTPKRRRGGPPDGYVPLREARWTLGLPTAKLYRCIRRGSLRARKVRGWSELFIKQLDMQKLATRLQATRERRETQRYLVHGDDDST